MQLVEKRPKVKLYTGNMCARQMLKNFIQSQKARKAHYLFGEIATYISSGEEVIGNNMEDKRNKTEQNCVSGAYPKAYFQHNSLSTTRVIDNEARREKHKYPLISPFFRMGTLRSLLSYFLSERYIAGHNKWVR